MMLDLFLVLGLMVEAVCLGWLILSVRDLNEARRERRMRTARLEERLARVEGISVDEFRARFDAALAARDSGR